MLIWQKLMMCWCLDEWKEKTKTDSVEFASVCLSRWSSVLQTPYRPIYVMEIGYLLWLLSTSSLVVVGALTMLPACCWSWRTFWFWHFDIGFVFCLRSNENEAGMLNLGLVLVMDVWLWKSDIGMHARTHPLSLCLIYYLLWLRSSFIDRHITQYQQ